jgi:tubulin polyglutamylase TTLL6/13
MLDHKLKPWLLEVNHSPSFLTDSQFDYSLKFNLIRDALRVLGLSQEKKAGVKKRKEREMRERIFGKSVKSRVRRADRNEKRGIDKTEGVDLGRSLVYV